MPRSGPPLPPAISWRIPTPLREPYNPLGGGGTRGLGDPPPPPPPLCFRGLSLVIQAQNALQTLQTPPPQRIVGLPLPGSPSKCTPTNLSAHLSKSGSTGNISTGVRCGFRGCRGGRDKAWNVCCKTSEKQVMLWATCTRICLTQYTQKDEEMATNTDGI